MNTMGLDFFAPFYRFIAQLFFGETQQAGYRKAASCFKPKNALFVGAGDGHYLPYFSNVFSRIDFIDVSEGMLRQLRKRNCYNPRNMRCFCEDFGSFSKIEEYDTIYMLFYLDMLTIAQKRKHVDKALSMLSKNGELIILDFKPGGLMQRVKLYFARLFFSILTFSKIPNVSEVAFCLQQMSHVVVESVLNSNTLLLVRVRPEAKANKR